MPVCSPRQKDVTRVSRGRTVFIAINVAALLLLAPAAGRSEQAGLDVQATLFGVGDIIMQAAPSEGAELTAQLMERLLNETPRSRGITLGDNCNDDGTPECYDRFDQSSWGRLMPWLFPTPGNHDYESNKYSPFYFEYFARAEPTSYGFYAFDWGSWRVLALNSELMENNNDPILQARRKAQLVWLERELQGHSKTQCVMAYFHRPPFSSGKFASPAWTMPLYRKLFKYGADLYVTGHEHFFSALPPLDPAGRLDPTYGVPGLVAGTGGAALFPKPKTLKYGELVIAKSLGILRIDLRKDAYDWAFIPVHAADTAASGTGACHANPAGYVD